MTKLTVSNVETADAGKYALKLKNVAGFEETSCQVVMFMVGDSDLY